MPNWPNPAFQSATPADGYWAAKIVASFTDAHLRAVVREARMPEVAADTLVGILGHRRDRTVEHWYRQVSPVEDVRVAEAGEVEAERELTLVFRDLGLEEDLRAAADTRYRWRFVHEGLDREASGAATASAGVAQRVQIPLGEPVSSTGSVERELSPEESVATVELRVTNEGGTRPPVVVYLRWAGSADGYRVAGLRH